MTRAISRGLNEESSALAFEVAETREVEVFGAVVDLSTG